MLRKYFYDLDGPPARAFLDDLMRQLPDVEINRRTTEEYAETNEIYSSILCSKGKAKLRLVLGREPEIEIETGVTVERWWLLVEFGPWWRTFNCNMVAEVISIVELNIRSAEKQTPLQ